MMRPDISKYSHLYTQPCVQEGDVCLGTTRYTVWQFMHSLANKPAVLDAIAEAWDHMVQDEADKLIFVDALLYASDCVDACDEAAR
jgi:hypothetical protein